MTDWKQLTRARGLGIPNDQVERFVPILDALEQSFTAIAADLPDDLGMAVDFGAVEK